MVDTMSLYFSIFWGKPATIMLIWRHNNLKGTTVLLLLFYFHYNLFNREIGLLLCHYAMESSATSKGYILSIYNALKVIYDTYNMDFTYFDHTFLDCSFRSFLCCDEMNQMLI